MSVFDSHPTRHRSSDAGRRNRPRRPRRRRRFAPGLSALEARALLSTLTVTNDSDSDPGSLRAELGVAKAGDVIKFAPSAYGTITLTGGPLSVATGVKIQGPGPGKVTVSGDGQSTVFDVQSGVTATISGLTITDGVASVAGAYGGGGVVNDGTLTLVDCVVTGNTAPNAEPDGGGLFTRGPLMIAGSTISGNSAAGPGGGIDSDQVPVTILGSTISGNTGAGGGGLGSFGGDVTLKDSTVSGNTGGGIEIERYSYGSGPIPQLNVADSVIAGNSGTSFGGGILASSANVTIRDSQIADNTASGNPGFGLALGGGIDMEGSLFAPTPGADQLTITGTTFVGNRATSSSSNTGGGAIHTKPYVTLSVSDSTFIDNAADSTAPAVGGALDLQSLTQGTITDCQFTGNQATVASSAGSFGGDAQGGAIDDEGSTGPATLTIKGTAFTRNLAQSAAGGTYGGAINAAQAGLTLTLSSSAFVDNTSAAGPSGSTTFAGLGDGGALNLYQVATTATDTSFIGNRALGGSATGAGHSAGLGSGGAIVDIFAPLTMTGCIVAGNRSVGGDGTGGATGGNAWGGGIVDYGGTLTFSDGAILGNSAVGGAGGGNAEGGGVFLSGSGAKASFTDALISLNSAIGGSGGGKGYGGGLYVATGALTTLKNTRVVGNFASTDGDNIYGP